MDMVRGPLMYRDTRATVSNYPHSWWFSLTPKVTRWWGNFIMSYLLMYMCRMLRWAGMKQGRGNVGWCSSKFHSQKRWWISLLALSSFTSTPKPIPYPGLAYHQWEKQHNLGILNHISFSAFFIHIILINPLYLNLNMTFPESFIYPSLL